MYEQLLFKRFKEREYHIGQKVEVYRNLNVPNAYSVRCAKTKLVLFHCNTVELKNCTFIVSEKMRKRVLEDKRRNVHAFIRGELNLINPLIEEDMKKVYYNPYNTANFIEVATNAVVHNGERVLVGNKFAYIE